MTPKVVVATITAELPRYYEYYDSIDRLILPPGSAKTQCHSSSPAKNRNIIIQNLLKTSFTHVFFTDDDHVYAPDTVMKLLARNVDIVSGLYCMKFPPFPLIALDNMEDKNMSRFIDMDQYGPNELIEVPRVPAGCLLLRISALKKMQEFFSDGYDGQHPYTKEWKLWFTIGQLIKDEWADDLWFCDRAQEAGIKVHLDTGVCATHITKCGLTPEYIPGKGWHIQHKINSELGVEFEDHTTGSPKMANKPSEVTK